jgi:NAD(P)-dependent dehydrogenase (short-subunit alcohol dehydrogenase family)
MNVNNAVALVVGASPGIGRAIAFDLLGAGAEVYMLAYDHSTDFQAAATRRPPATDPGESGGPWTQYSEGRPRSQ